MSYQPSTYPGAPAYPSASQYGDAQQSHQQQSNQHYGNAPAASSYYGGGESQYGGQGGPNGQQPPVQQFDERGNPIPVDGERGLGTMAIGAIGGVTANKLSGDHHSSFKSGIAGALLAQGAKMAYEGFNKHNNHGPSNHQQQQQGGYPYGGNNHHNGGGGGLGSFFNKREL